jgi:hypothetical protein
MDYQKLAPEIEKDGGLEMWVDKQIATFLATDNTKEAFSNLIKLAED